MQNRKEITKTQYKLMVWGSIIVGLIAYSFLVVSIMFLNLEPSATRQSLLLGLAGMIIGIGIGWATAYSFKIKDYKY